MYRSLFIVFDTLELEPFVVHSILGVSPVIRVNPVFIIFWILW